jgi:proteasome lid subunit RPN8/RPN11
MTLEEYEPFLPFTVKNDILAHMDTDSPKEACGLITLSSGKYQYEPQKNISKDQDHHFQFDKRTSTRLITDDSVVAYVHSHPFGQAMASKLDMEIQKRVGKPSVISSRDPLTGIVEVFSFGDHLLTVPLIGREFRYTALDCYEAYRSWYFQVLNIKMPQVPRHNEWWNRLNYDNIPVEDQDMYSKYYKDQGFRNFEPVFSDPDHENTPKVGDVLLMQMGADVANHIAVYVGNNLIYHHRAGKRSSEMPLGYCLNNGYIRHWLRLEKKL